MTLKQLINKTGKYFTGGVGLLTIDGYIRYFKDKKLLERYNFELDRNRMLDALVSRKESLDIVREDVKSMTEIKYNLTNTIEDDTRDNLISMLSPNLNNIAENIGKSNDKLSDVIDLLFNSGSGSKTNFLFVEDITKFISMYQDYLSTLTLAQTGALVHIIVSLFIFFCLFTIIGIFYGDTLIRYLNLEEKYPKLARFIQLRRKFQQYYFILNMFLIFIALSSIIYVNLLIFFYP
jgi:hypothetical protein